MNINKTYMVDNFIVRFGNRAMSHATNVPMSEHTISLETGRRRPI
ncbi:hypothetical protein [Paenibacillus xylanexedens]|nr:hypothetical protein [Paenibacillus xylanexedens]